MTFFDFLTYIATFVSGSVVGSLITLNVNSRKTKQSKISVGKGDVVAGDKTAN